MVERGGLENRCAFRGTEGSNPSLSASFSSISEMFPAGFGRCPWGLRFGRFSGGGFPTARTGNHRFDGVKRIFCPIFLGPQNPVPLCAITMLRGTLERIEALHIPMANQKRLPNSSRIFSNDLT